MAAVIGASREDLASAIAQVEGYVIPANFNAPGQIVVSGDAEAVQALGVILKQQKKRLIPLRVSGAFHSAHMDEAAAKLRVDLDRVNWQKPALPLFMNIDAKNHAEDFAAIMEKQCKSPVYWEDTLYALRDAGAEVFVECGPGGVLTGLIKKTLPGLPAYCVEDMAGLGVALEALKEE